LPVGVIAGVVTATLNLVLPPGSGHDIAYLAGLASTYTLAFVIVVGLGWANARPRHGESQHPDDLSMNRPGLLGGSRPWK
jgi:hypothetical protein